MPADAREHGGNGLWTVGYNVLVWSVGPSGGTNGSAAAGALNPAVRLTPSRPRLAASLIIAPDMWVIPAERSRDSRATGSQPLPMPADSGEPRV